MSNLENYFLEFRKNIIGIDQKFSTPFVKNIKILYADWTASGRNYLPIEERIINSIMPFVANTHTDTSATSSAMTYAYHQAQKIIKKHVNASKDDILISSNAGMTGVINKFQRILGLKIHEQFKKKLILSEEDTPVVFITHMEHHSNQTSWLETIADVEIIPPGDDGLVDLDNFSKLIEKYQNRKLKIAAVTSCSNVTGVYTPYYKIAKMIHAKGGYCFVDFACSAPYVDIDMHPPESGIHLDAIYFSPHKFLGGPGSSGILLFNKKLHKNSIPDNPGGGTVHWTDPWGGRQYINDIEIREDGGTPPFLQTIKVAFSTLLKDEMGVENILNREEEIMSTFFNRLDSISNLHILAKEHKNRLGIISFCIDELQYNTGVKILNDRFGIQCRGGCSCAGTYGHFLLNLQKEHSHVIAKQINLGNYSQKPGWIRISVHPTMTNDEVAAIVDAIEKLAKNHDTWSKDYLFDASTGRLIVKNGLDDTYITTRMNECFSKKFV